MESKKVKPENHIKWLILFVLIIFAAATYRKFSFHLEELSTNQATLIQNQTKLMAANQLLKPDQLKQIHCSALNGDILAIETLSIYYNRSDQQDKKNMINAYVWKTLLSIYSKHETPNNKHHSSLSNAEIKTANERINKYEIEIDNNLKLQSEAIDEITKSTNEVLRNPASIVSKTMKNAAKQISEKNQLLPSK